ncbi:MAG: hypothetical protein KDK39_06435 [Leptospiraceae bacterium]|nr:hypothetical protein [Leptospiraceae bacterium]
MTKSPAHSSLAGLKGPPLVQALHDLRDQAIQGNADALQDLTTLLQSCRQTGIWHQNGSLASGVLHAVSELGSLKSMQSIVSLVRGLPDGVPAGVIELIANLLPIYKSFVRPTLREWIQLENDSPAYLIGIQTMCNLYMADKLDDAELDYLQDHLRNFNSGDYITRHIVDLVRSDLDSRRAVNQDELEAIYRDLLD